MTQLAEILFHDTPPLRWKQLFNQQRSVINQVSYHYRQGQGQFNVSELAPADGSHCQYYLCLLTATLPTHAVLTLLQALSKDGNEIMVYPPAQFPLTTDKSCQGEIMVLGLPALTADAIEAIKTNLNTWSQDYHIDYALTPSLPSLSEPGVVLMDMDSTTIQIECIDEIAKLAGVGEQVAAVTARAMNGELDFADSLRSRVATLAGCPATVLAEVADNMPLMPGLQLLIQTLHQANWQVAIASGGFSYFAARLQRDLGFDAVFANELEIIDGVLTGKVLGNIVDAQVKADTLHNLTERAHIPAAQTVAIGDGANDLLMLANAALGVAIHAKPIVQQQAQVALNFHDLQGLVGLLHGAACVSANWD